MLAPPPGWYIGAGCAYEVILATANESVLRQKQVQMQRRWERPLDEFQDRLRSVDVVQNGSMDCLAPQRLDNECAVWAQQQQQLQELGASDDGDLYWEQHQEQQ